MGGTATTMIVMIPTPDDQPGWVFSSVFYVANIVWVLWARTGVERHLGRDGASKILPTGAENLPLLWAKAVLWGNPVLLLGTNIIQLVVWFLSKEMYGGALAVVYYVVSLFLI